MQSTKTMKVHQLAGILAECDPEAEVGLWLAAGIADGSGEDDGCEEGYAFEVVPLLSTAAVDADSKPDIVSIRLTDAATYAILLRLATRDRADQVGQSGSAAADAAAEAEAPETDVCPEGMREFILADHKFFAENCIEGVLINPQLPASFNDTANEARPESHGRWWNRPYIVTHDGAGTAWQAAWPSGTRYQVRCLDGGAWDRSTTWGAFRTAGEAFACAQGR